MQKRRDSRQRGDAGKGSGRASQCLEDFRLLKSRGRVKSEEHPELWQEVIWSG